MDVENANADSASRFEWTRDVALLTNRFILYDSVKLLGWSFLAMATLLSIVMTATGELEAVPQIVAMSALATGVLGVLFLLVMALVFMNRFRMTMRVAESGASVDSASRVGKAGNRIAIVAGLLSGRPGLAGAGMLGKAQEHSSIRWDEVYRVHEHPQQRVLSLMNSWRVVIRLYCEDGNYAAVRDFVRVHAQEGARRRRDREAREAAKPKAPSHVGRRLALTVAVGAATFCVVATPFEFDARLLAACVVLTLAGVWTPVGRVPLALVALCVTIAIVGVIGAEGSRVRHLVPAEVLNGTPEPAWSRYTGWSRLDTGEWLRLALTGAGLLALAALQALGLRPRRPAARAK